MNIYILLRTLNKQPKIIFAYNKKHYGEAILANIGKLEKTINKYLSYINHLQFSVCCHHSKILLKDLQLKSRNKTERSKTVLQCSGKLFLQERIHFNQVILDMLKISIEQLKGKIFKSITPEEFHFVEKICIINLLIQHKKYIHSNVMN